MEDNSLLVIVLAFVLGCMCSGMMKQMCGQRLVEGEGKRCHRGDNSCGPGEYCYHPPHCAGVPCPYDWPGRCVKH